MFMVPRARLELAQPLSPGILSPLRLPIPPSGQPAKCFVYLQIALAEYRYTIFFCLSKEIFKNLNFF